MLGDSCDIDFTVNQNQYIVWAIGGLGETAFIHFQRSDSKCMGGNAIVPICLPLKHTHTHTNTHMHTHICTRTYAYTNAQHTH